MILTGPESSGKSVLSEALSQKYDGLWIPEYARAYVENLNRDYTYSDVEHIARIQVKEYEDAIKSEKEWLFFDTSLIITKIWFTYIFNKYPTWLDDAIEQMQVDLFLLCKPDLPWVADGVREHENKRQELFVLYKKELERYNKKYNIVSGEAETRFQCAINHINQAINLRDDQ
ncbi:ATP-binding protein [Marinilabiliaceae bacterium N1Y90]|nr:ATP-binding protein [Marinilabiliaceae bacterium N1Y90]